VDDPAAGAAIDALDGGRIGASEVVVERSGEGRAAVRAYGALVEREREGSTSREDPREAEYVADLAEALLAAGLPATDLAVISPYDDQVRRIDDRLEAEGVEVDTVDGFQGREREVALVSLARSNERSEVGFLSDERRFNVSLTRAQSKAVVVGDADTGTSECVYDDFVDYVRGRADGRVAALGS